MPALSCLSGPRLMLARLPILTMPSPILLDRAAPANPCLAAPLRA